MWKGIVIDSKLNFSEYIHMASKIANAMAVTRRSLWSFVSFCSVSVHYKSVVRPTSYISLVFLRN